jgi:hypothetical protein
MRPSFFLDLHNKTTRMRSRRITSIVVIILLLTIPSSLIAQRHDAKWQKMIARAENVFTGLRSSFGKIEEHIPVAEFKSSIQVARSTFRKHTRSHKHRKRVRSKSEVFVMMQFSMKTR